jgi:hypothetical protein
MVGYIFGGDTGETVESLKRKRSVAEALLARSSRAPQNVGEGLSAIGNALLYRSMLSDVEKGEAQGEASAANDRAAFYTGFGSDASAPAAGGASSASAIGTPGAAAELAATSPAKGFNYDPTIKTGIAETASALGIDPVDLATAISYETAGTFDPTKGGPRTQWGQHKGLIQFGEPQAQKYGVDWENPVGSQLGPEGAVAKYLRDTGVKPGMGLLDIYSAINAGGVGRYNASDANNGGAPGNVRDKVEQQMADHRAKALAMFSPNVEAASSGQEAINAVAPPSGALDPSAVSAATAYVDPMVSAPNFNPNAPLPQEAAPLPSRNVGPSPVVAALAGDPSAPRQISPVAAALAGQTAASPMPASDMAATTGRAVVAPGGRKTAVAQALAGKDYFPAAPNAPGQSGPSIQQAIQLLNNPYASQTDRAMAADVVERAQKARDPAYQLELETKRAQLDALKSKPTKQWQRLDDNTLYNPETGETKELPVSAKPTNDQQNYEYYRRFETDNGRQPLGPLEWEQAQRKAGASSTSVTVGEGDKFYENLDKKNAETFAAMSDAGIQARAKLGQIDRLEGLFANVPQGAVGGLKKIAGDWGIAVGDGTSDIQAASALLEKMVPEQRAPGSGPMSDADIKMFRGSLPRVLNQPGGNQLIFGTLRGIAQYEQQVGEIADAVADRTISPAEGRKRIREMKNPLADFKIPEGSTPNHGFKTKTGVQWSVE